MSDQQTTPYAAGLIPEEITTIRQGFLRAAEGEGELVRIDHNEEERRVSYRDLKTRAATIAGQLALAGARPGEPVILIMEDPLAFASGFWACILGGLVAVPLPPMENAAQRERTLGAMGILDRPWLLSDLPLTDEGAIDPLVGGRWVLAGPDFDHITDLPRGMEPAPRVSAGDVAIIQFSSGSTGRPKGILLRQGSVLANIVALAERVALTPEDVLVNWMPLSHDFGLFHYHILPLMTGIKQVLLAPQTFARKPVSWIRAMDRHRATVSGAPNFALRLVTTIMKPARAATFDLRSLRHITNGAEPLDARTIAAFVDALAPAGLNPLAIRPAYGLAEATLVVTMSHPGVALRTLHVDRGHLAIGERAIRLAAEEDEAMTLLALGPPVRSTGVRIVDDQGAVLGENVIGHIQVRTPSLMSGYINDRQASEEALLADGWLDTGDIGFMDQGELVTNCRAKDLIIVNGVNFYPADIEMAAESTPGLGWANTVTITQARMPDGNDEVVVVFVRYRGREEEFVKLAWKIEESVLAKTGLAIDYCLPVHSMPKTTSGKVQRFDLANRFSHGEFAPQLQRARQIQSALGQPLAEAMRLGNSGLAARLIANEAESLTGTPITPVDPLMEQGVSSLQAVALCNRLVVMSGRPLNIAAIFDHPTALALAEFLMHRRPAEREEPLAAVVRERGEVAVIGYGCRFPGGANDGEAFWRLLEADERDLTRPIPADRWAMDAGAAEEIPGRAAFLDDIDGFDHAFFGIPPAEAAALEPRQRLLLEVLWQCLEHAGLDPEQLRGRRVGLFVGLSESGVASGDTRLIPDQEAAWTYGVTGSAGSIAVGRLAHIFDFRGPALAIDTACSSSLVAIQLAMRAIHGGECELTIAGGVNLLVSPELHAGLARMGALARDGRCKTFAAEADGYGRGEGAGLVILKARQQAEADGDSIHGLLLGGAQNHDGASQNVTAPNGQAQRQLLRRALLDADIGGSEVDWIETHGTGTPLGDPIEVAALMDVFPRKGADTLPLGAVKSRIGHLEAAAGVAGVIKVLLAMRHQRIPGNGRRLAPNPNIDWQAIPARPLDHPLDWPVRRGQRRIAGISAFGMSGTNAHLLLAEPGEAALPEERGSGNCPLLAMGARGAAALDALRASWLERLSASAPGQWPALLAGACARRGGHRYRLAVPLDPLQPREALQRLAAARGGEALPRPSLLFAFSGQGAQAPGMLHDLYQAQPVFKAAVDEASALAGPIAGRSLVEWLYGEQPADRQRIDRTDLAQPALVAVAWGLVRLLAEWGVRPHGVVGHSVGEIPAALVAGVIDLGAAMGLARLRGEVMEALTPEGGMVAVSAGEEAVRPLLAGLRQVVIAGYNGPNSLTVSGPPAAMEEFRRRARAAALPTRPLHVSRAFHGPAMAPAATRLAEALATINTRPLGLPLFSTMTGASLPESALAEVGYWRQQMLSPVRFSQAVAAAEEAGFDLAIEIGPRSMLAKLGPAAAPGMTWVAIHDAQGSAGQAPLALALARLWRAGAKVDWRRYHGCRGVGGEQLPRHPLNRVAVPRLPWPGREPATPLAVNVRVASATRASCQCVSKHGDAANSVPPQGGKRSQGAPDARDMATRVVKPLLVRIAGLNEAEISGKQSFLAHGLDSLMIIQLQRAVKSETGQEIPVADFYDGAETPERLAEVLSRNPPALPARPAEEAAPGQERLQPASGDLAALMQAQLRTVHEIIQQQLETLARSGLAVPRAAAGQETAAVALPAPKGGGGEIKGLFRQPNRSAKGLSAGQQAHVERLARAWNRKSAGSKRLAAADRGRVASSRAVFGYRQEYKELVYPLVVERAQGAKVWDVDGHEYVDITMGFGVNLFGHNPPFVHEAMAAELERGAAIGPVSRLAGEVAARIHQLTGVERCAFFSTGTEAIMCAVRLARAVTGRQRLVIFKGAYHGSFDGVLATGWIDSQGRPQTMPMTDGTPEAMVESVIVLEYGDMAGLEVIARHAGEIALVLVEPVQSRNPGNLPVEFLRALRRLTSDRDVPLLFDEIISGFRFAPGGMQQLLGIEADLVTYGKVLGHGQPFGVVAGKARFMDAVDGGQWSYGDASAPGVRTAFVAGTFNGHPLSLAAARAVLSRIAADQGALQEELAAKTEAMCQRLDRLFTEEGVAVRMERYGSLFRFGFGEDTEILNTHLLLHGVFVWEQRNCFLSTAHRDEDIEAIIQAASLGVAAMKEDGWFALAPSSQPSLPSPRLLPTSQSQRAMWHRAHDPAAPGSWTDMLAIAMNGSLDRERLATAVATVVLRHPALSTVQVDESTQVYSPVARAGLELLDLTAEQDADAALGRWLKRAVRRPFAPDRAAIRLLLATAGGGSHTLVTLASHLAFDGWSMALIVREILAAYAGQPLPEVDALEAYLAWEATALPQAGQRPPTAMELPGVLAGHAANPHQGSRLTRTGLTELQRALLAKARECESTPMVLMLAAYAIWLSRLVNQRQVTIGLPCAGQLAAGIYSLVANVSFVRPLTIDLDGEEGLDAFVRRLQAQVVAEARSLPSEALPRRHVLFNLDGPLSLAVEGVEIAMRPVPIAGARADLFVNLLSINGELLLDVDWPTARFDQATVASWVEQLLVLAQRITSGGGTVGEVAAAAHGDPGPEGVVDWLGLPALAGVDVASGLARPRAKASPPKSPEPLSVTGARLAVIWQSLLGGPPPVGEDDFFARGGGSLTGVRLLAAVADAFACAITLADLFAHSRLVEMAALIDGREAGPGAVLQAGDRRMAPVAPQQRRLWLLEEMAETVAAYAITLSLDFPWPLAAEALTQALQAVARRHDTLRTAIVVAGELPVQTIAEAITPPLTVEDLRGDAEWSARRADRLLELAATPIPLHAAPLWRVQLLRTPEGDTLCLSIHHIISDVWSVEILVRDVLEGYRLARLGISSLRPELAFQYGDYCRWLADAAGAEQRMALAYWRQQLDDVPPLTTIPGDQPRPASKSFAGARLRTAVSGPPLVALGERVTGCKSSLFQMVLAAVAMVVRQRTGQTDLLLGTVSACRDRAGLEDVVGMFANTLPIRFNFADSTTVGEVLGLAREQLLAATAHDLASLDEIVQALGLPRDPGHNPLFEVCVTHDDRHGIGRIAAEHGCLIQEVVTPTTQFDLSFYVMEAEEALLLEVTYATAIFNPSTVEGILAEIVATLAVLANDPDQHLPPLSRNAGKSTSPSPSRGEGWQGGAPGCGHPHPASAIGGRELDDSGQALADGAPLEAPSPHQERLWFVDRFENGQLYAAAPVYYNMALVHPLAGPLAPQELERRLHRLYQSLPHLGRQFRMDGELPGLMAGPPAIAAIGQLSASSLSALDFAGELAGFAGHPFDLSRDGLLRAAILRSGAGEEALVLVGHHMVVDAWSLEALARLLIRGEQPADAACRFLECALRERRAAEAWPVELAYWRQQLSGVLPRLVLPLDRPRPAIHTFTLGLALQRLSAAAVTALRTVAARFSLNVDDMVLAALVVLLQRLSMQETIVLGTTVAVPPGVARTVIGPLTNLVTLKVAVEQEAGIKTFLGQIGQQLSQAVAHGAIPFDTVVLDLKPKNDMSRTALFDVLHVRDELAAGGEPLLPAAIGWGKYDLTLAGRSGDDGELALALAFNLDILDQATADHWLEMLTVLLRGLPEAIDGTLLAWPLLAADAQASMPPPLPRSQEGPRFAQGSLPAAFAARVAATPEAIALVDGELRLSYRSLEERANRIANRLLALGVGPEERVAILLERGADWPLAMLGVLKAGAAFVPIAPGAAVDRTLGVMATAAIKAMIVDHGVDPALLGGGLPLVNLASEELASISAADPGLAISGSQLAYVIFTSGSTGSPKGVMVEHKSVLALILGQGELFALGRDQVWSWFHSPAFDFSIWEIWGALLTGGRLLVVPQTAQQDMAELHALLRHEQVTLLSLTPSAFYSLAAYEAEQPRAALAVRSVWFGGEALTPTLLAPWAKRYPACRLLNLFGITETTVHVTCRLLTPADLLRSDSIIGHALPSYSVSIRDPLLRLVPPGIGGEIVVGGSGVARGYLGQPQLTAERFVDDPLAPGRRIYRSGDLGRTLLNGELVYLGRMDEQIKMRGFRIEPGEIEHALLRLPGVRGAVVATRPAADGAIDQLVAWLVAEEPPGPEEMANRLARLLPAYMIPSRFYRVDAIPLTANGKADRRRLAAMDADLLGPHEAGARPRAGLETEIAAIWQTLLAVDGIGRDDNFFALGGHSLKANQAVLRIRRQLGLELTLKEFFSAQSVAALAAVLEGRQPQREEGLPPAPELAAYPLSSPQRRLFAMQQADPGSVSYNMVGGFVVSGRLEPARLARAFGRLVNRHEILRTRFAFVEGVPAQMVGPAVEGFALAVSRAAAAESEAEAIDRLLAAEFAHCFDLGRGPMLRAHLLELAPAADGEARSLLVINLHHIVADGWSVAVLMENLAHFYGNDGASLPPLARQYKDFAHWQARAFAHGGQHPALAFWQGRLLDEAMATTLPADFPRPAVRSGQGAMARRLLPETLSARVRQAAVDAGTTLFVVCSALVHALLHLRSGAAATIIGTADAGRDLLEVEEQVGFYLNLLPLRLAVDPAAPLSHWLAAAKEEAGAVLAHKGYPFDLVLEKLAVATPPGHSPVFDLLLLLQNNATPSGRFADLRIEPLADRTVSSKYDLNLMVEDRPLIELVLEYDSALFRRETAEWFVNDLARLLEALVAGHDPSPVAVLHGAVAVETGPGLGILESDDPLLGMG